MLFPGCQFRFERVLSPLPQAWSIVKCLERAGDAPLDCSPLRLLSDAVNSWPEQLPRKLYKLSGNSLTQVLPFPRRGGRQKPLTYLCHSPGAPNTGRQATGVPGTHAMRGRRQQAEGARRGRGRDSCSYSGIY